MKKMKKIHRCWAAGQAFLAKQNWPCSYQACHMEFTVLIHPHQQCGYVPQLWSHYMDDPGFPLAAFYRPSAPCKATGKRVCIPPCPILQRHYFPKSDARALRKLFVARLGSYTCKAVCQATGKERWKQEGQTPLEVKKEGRQETEEERQSSSESRIRRRKS